MLTITTMNLFSFKFSYKPNLNRKKKLSIKGFIIHTVVVDGLSQKNPE